MTERIVRPVRAWADYDQWLGYLEYRHRWLEWTWAEIPKGAAGDLYSDTNEVNSVVEAVSAWGWSAGREFGPLRSLRVLYENGWWLRLEPLRGPTTTAIHDWLWYLHQEQDAPEIPHGQFTEDKDSEAVQRAMIAAGAWFSQRQD